jgi:CubicO group peptidase (beta-lactamase class C family)
VHVIEDAVRHLLDTAARDGTFPGAVARVSRAGEELFTHAAGVVSTDPPGAPVGLDTIYDLASLTKVLCTTPLAAIAIDEGRVALDTAVPSGWAGGCPGATLTDLLEHCAGLEAHREYFAETSGKDEVFAKVIATPPAYPLRSQAVYSDLGFIILGVWLERLFDATLDDVFRDRIAGPLGAELVFGPEATDRVAPTEVYDRPSSYYEVRKGARMAHGQAHDDNCWAMGGVAGHAGLFGDAAGVLTVATAWLDGAFPLRDRFFTRSTVPGSTRCLGFDGPGLIGHTGFTGNSLWIDPDARAIYVLLSNRVHPTRTNNAIRAFRPRFHEAAAKLL